MKKLIFAVVVLVVSLVVFSSCSEDRVLTDLEVTEDGEGGGVGEDDPIFED